MTLEEQLKYCRSCQNRKMTMEVGIVCSLTGAKPTFQDQCADYNIDEPEAQRLARMESEALQVEEHSDGFGLERKAINKGVPGGILMIVIAIVWFFGGLSAGIIFYYPPILLLIGLYAVVRGVIKGKNANA